MTRSKMAIQVEESRADQKVEGFKQQLADELALATVDDLVELEEIVEEAEGDKEGETPIRDCQEKIKKKEEKEKEIKKLSLTLRKSNSYVLMGLQIPLCKKKRT